MVISILLVVFGLVGTVFFVSLAMALGGAGSQSAVVWPVLGGIVSFALFFTGMNRLGRRFRRDRPDRRDRWDSYHRH